MKQHTGAYKRCAPAALDVASCWLAGMRWGLHGTAGKHHFQETAAHGTAS